MQVIAVINFKVGSGKTTTAAHLAQKLALDGYRVLGIDLDPQASLSTLHGFQPEFDLLDGGTLNDAIRYDDPVPLRRVDTDREGIEALKVSLSEYGQQVPVLLRHSATQEGRFDIVFGRRRVQALKELGLPVKAMIRTLNDRDLVIAQGQENTARKDLSFIEKANFAAQMQQGGFDRKVICDALTVDKTLISRMLTIVDALPKGLIRAIGAAPNAGRDRWMALAEKARGHSPEALIAAAKGPDSDARFLAVLAQLAPPKPATNTRALQSADGGALGHAAKLKGKIVIELSGQGREFADWLVDHIEDLHRDWSIKNQ